MANKTETRQETAKDGVKTTKPKVIATRISEEWVFVKDTLEMFRNYWGKLDKGFWHRFGQLLDYVYSKIELPEIGGDILDSCVVVWQKVDDKHDDADYEKWVSENIKFFE